MYSSTIADISSINKTESQYSKAPTVQRNPSSKSNGNISPNKSSSKSKRKEEVKRSFRKQ